MFGEIPFRLFSGSKHGCMSQALDVVGLNSAHNGFGASSCSFREAEILQKKKGKKKNSFKEISNMIVWLNEPL